SESPANNSGEYPGFSASECDQFAGDRKNIVLSALSPPATSQIIFGDCLKIPVTGICKVYFTAIMLHSIADNERFHPVDMIITRELIECCLRDLYRGGFAFCEQDFLSGNIIHQNIRPFLERIELQPSF